MIVFTDSINYTEGIFGDTLKWRAFSVENFGTELAPLAQQIFAKKNIHTTTIDSDSVWGCAFVTEFAPQSQFDILADFMRANQKFTDGIICLAGSGENFKGQHQRSWVSIKGNIHLSLCLNPNRAVENFNLGFTILPAVSVIQAIDCCPALENRSAIKWVNDVLIDGAKVAGVLTKTQVQGEQLTAVVLGIGINVEARPEFVPDLVVPRAGCLQGFIAQRDICSPQFILEKLLNRLAANYRRLLAGGYTDLLNFYRHRSAIIGREIIVLSDPVDNEPEQIMAGIVERIGDNLELFLQNREVPVIRGRVAFKQ